MNEDIVRPNKATDKVGGGLLNPWPSLKNLNGVISVPSGHLQYPMFAVLLRSTVTISVLLLTILSVFA